MNHDHHDFYITFWFWSCVWFPALRQGCQNHRTVCNFSIWMVTGVYKKVVQWRRNHKMPL